MTVFRLKQLASTSAHAAAGAIRWNYDRAELIADGIVHGIGVFSGLIAATVLIVLAAIFASVNEIVSVSVYAAGLLAMLGFSAAYNLWPVSRGKWLLRRFDHSAIYILIAATYTPVFAQLQDRVFAMSLLAGVWSVAAVGIVLKLFFPGRFDRVSVGLYLAMGWSGLIAYDAGLSSLPQLALVVHRRRRPALQLRGHLSRLAAACASRTRSGILSCCWARPATTPPCSIWFWPRDFSSKRMWRCR